jgi:anti-sigma regulatory factor (Ser/Thr protein kinase)
MRGKRILFYDPDPRARRVAERALAATGSECVSAHDADDLMVKVEANGWDLMMINYDPPLRDDPRWSDRLGTIEHRWPRTKLVLHSTAPTEDYLPLMATRRFLRNVIAKNDEPLEPDELIITAEKLLRGDLFGLQKYLLWGVEPYCVKIQDSRDKQDYISQVSSYAASLGCNERVVELIETIVDELVTNAIYNAPRTPSGEAKYAKMSRREPVRLEDHEVGELQFACDGDYIAVAQIDPFGALTQETVVSYLNRCLVKGPDQISEASGGAGIGLFRVFQSLSKFVINVDPGRKTEVITLIDLRLSMKRFRQATKSFHIFINDRSPPPAAAGGGGTGE